MASHSQLRLMLESSGIVQLGGRTMINKSIIKRTCAGILAFLMVGTSYPVTALADDNIANEIASEDISIDDDVSSEVEGFSEDKVIDAVDEVIEESIEKMGIMTPIEEPVFEEDEQIEEDPDPDPDPETPEYWQVEIGLLNIDSIQYVFGEQTGDVVLVPESTSEYRDTGLCYHEAAGLGSETKLTIKVPTKYDHLIITKVIRKDREGITIVDPYIKDGRFEQLALTKDNTYVQYKDSDGDKKYAGSTDPKITGYDFVITSDRKLDADESKNITIKSPRQGKVKIDVSNIASFDYAIVEGTPASIVAGGVIEESYKSAEAGKPRKAFIHEEPIGDIDEYSVEKVVPNGYTLAIWNVVKKYKNYDDVTVDVDGEAVNLMGFPVPNASDVAPVVDAKAYVFDYNYVAESGAGVLDTESTSTISVGSRKLCAVNVGLSAIEGFNYATIPADAIEKDTRRPIHLYGYKEYQYQDAKISGKFAYFDSERTGENPSVKAGDYLVIFDIKTAGEASGYIVMDGKNAAKTVAVNIDDKKDEDEVQFESETAYLFKISDNKDDITINSKDVKTVTLELANIKRLEYIVVDAEKLENVPTSYKKTVNIPVESYEIDEDGHRKTYKLDLVIPDNYVLILLSATRINENYERPVLTINGLDYDVEQEAAKVGKYNTGDTIYGHKLAKVVADIPTGINISAKAKTQKVKIVTKYAQSMSYAVSATKEGLKDTVEKAIAGETSEYGAYNTAFVHDGVLNVFDIDLDLYFAIFDLAPNVGCYGSPVIKKDGKPVDPIIITNDEDVYVGEYYTIGQVNRDIENVTAEIDESAYDVVVFTADVQSFKYVYTNSFVDKVIPEVIEAGGTDDATKLYNHVNNIVVTSFETQSGFVIDATNDKAVFKDEKQLPEEINGYARITGIPKGSYFAITSLKKAYGGTKLNEDSVFIDGQFSSYRRLGSYSDTSKLNGWILEANADNKTSGAIVRPYPIITLDSIETDDNDEVVVKQNYTIDGNVAKAVSGNYRMNINLWEGPKIKIAYKDGFYTRKSSDNYALYYTDVVWNEDHDAFETKDLVVDLRSTSPDYDVWTFNPNLDEPYVQTSNVYAHAYRTQQVKDEVTGETKTVKQFSDPESLSFKYDDENIIKYGSPVFVLPKEIIEGWLKVDGDGWEGIEIVVKPYLEVYMPSEKDDLSLFFDVYRFDETLKRVDGDEENDGYRKHGELHIENFQEYMEELNGDKWGYGDSIKFVVLPKEVEDDDFNEDYIVDFEWVLEGHSSTKFRKNSLPSDYEMSHYYQLTAVDRDMDISAELKTKHESVKFKVINNTECTPSDDNNGNRYGKARFSSKDTSTPKLEDSDKHEYSCKVKQGVTKAIITVEQTMASAQLEFLLKGYGDDEAKEIAPKTHTAKGVYTFEIPVRLLKNAEITLNNKWTTKDLYMQYDPEQVTVTVTAQSTTIPYIESDEDPIRDSIAFEGYKIYHYMVPENEYVTVNAKKHENCKVNYAYIYNKAKYFDNTGNCKHYVTDSNRESGMDYVVYTTPLKTLYFGSADYDDEGNIIMDGGEVKYTEEPHTSNKFSTTVEKDRKYRAYIRLGDLYKEELKPENIKVTVASKTISTGTVVTVEDDYLNLDFSNKDVAGNTVKITITKNKVTLGVLTLKVSPYATTATIKGEKSGVVTQDLLSDKSYKVTFNKGVKSTDMVAIYRYYDESTSSWVTFTDETNDFTVGEGELLRHYKFFEFDDVRSVLTIRANRELDKTKASAGMPRMQVIFVDKTDANYVKGAKPEKQPLDVLMDNKNLVKEIRIEATTLNKLTPQVKLTSSSDMGLNLTITAPKSYTTYYNGMYLTGDPVGTVEATNAGLYYIVAATANDNTSTPRPSQMLPSKVICVPATGLYTTVDLRLLADNKPNTDPEVPYVSGDGAAWKYKVTVRAVYGLEPVKVGVDYKVNPEYGISKLRTLNNQSTKNPYHETKLTSAIKSATILQGQEHALVGKAKFSSKTTFFDLTAEIKDANGDTIEGLVFEQGNPDKGENPAEMYLRESATLEPGTYTVCLYADPKSSAATSKLIVGESIKQDKFSIVIPSDVMYKKSGSTATMTATIKYEPNETTGLYPKVKKVTWSIERAADVNADTGFDILRYVSIDKNSGKITVAKDFKYQNEEKSLPTDNQFVVVATAADYTSTPARYAKYETPVSIHTWDAKINALELYKDTAPAVPVDPTAATSKYKYAIDSINKIVIDGTALAKNCTFKSSNTNVIKLDDDPYEGNAFKVKVTGFGKTVITVTSKDGAGATKSLTVNIVPSNVLAVTVDGSALNPAGPVEMSYEHLNGKPVAVLDGTTEILTGYTLSVSGGAKMFTYDGVKYVKVTGPDISFKLVDKSRASGKPGHTQIFKVKIYGWHRNDAGKAIVKGIGISLSPSSMQPSEGSLIKLSGIRGREESYSVVFEPEIVSYMKSENYYKHFGEAFTGTTSIIRTGRDFAYNAKAGAYIPNGNTVEKPSDAKDAFRLKTGNDFKASKAIPGSYNMTAVISDEDGIVAIKSVKVGIKAPSQPTIVLIDNYSLSATADDKAVIKYNTSKSKKMNLCYSLNYVEITDASINGEIKLEASKYLTLVDVEGGEKVLKLKDDTNISQHIGETIYCNLTYVYQDMAGVSHEVTKIIKVGIRG